MSSMRIPERLVCCLFWIKFGLPRHKDLGFAKLFMGCGVIMAEIDVDALSVNDGDL